MRTARLALVVSLAVIAAFYMTPVSAQKGQSGATLDASKTFDICSIDSTTWRYSGIISVWNSGAVSTIGLAINDFVESKVGGGPDWTFGFIVPVAVSGEIPAGTTEGTAVTFPYSIDAPAVVGSIRNNLTVTILNHSGHLGVAFGPNPKVSFTGTILPCPTDLGCTYTQGYWGNKPGVVWPAPYSRDAFFYLSGQTWQGVLDTAPSASPGYYQLAHQYIAAVLNIHKAEHPAYVPSGIQDILNQAAVWFGANAPSACTAKGSCGLQKTWAATLDEYNNGLYPGGPGHCGDE